MFEGLKVVELASVLAGPSVGMFFAEQGATVIKIENKLTGGDLTRHWKLPNENKDSPYSAYYSSINYNKKILLLNLKKDDDFHIALSHIKDADIVISNYRKEQAKRLKLDYETLKLLNPKLIYAQLTGFGEHSQRPAFDVVLQAEAGFLYMCGEANRPPVKMPVALIDVLAAHQLKEGILTALWKREKDGKGALIKTSLYQSAIASLVNQASNYLMAGHIPQKMGTQHPNIAPYGDMFYTRDNKAIVLAIGTDAQFENLCTVLNIDLHQNILFNSSVNRVKNRTQLINALSKIIINHNINEIEKLFLVHQVPYGRIRNMQEVFENPLAQEMVLEENFDDKYPSKRVQSIAFTIKRE